MKRAAFILVIILGIVSCNTPKKARTSNDITNKTEQDTVRIANDKLEYEIIIIEPGFNVWLEVTAKPKGYYSQQFLESRNRLFVTAWNSRVLEPSRYDPNLYEMQIDYRPNIDYGYDVNYKLYNYFIFFQLQYKQQLTSFVPRI